MSRLSVVVRHKDGTKFQLPDSFDQDELAPYIEKIQKTGFAYIKGAGDESYVVWPWHAIDAVVVTTVRGT